MGILQDLNIVRGTDTQAERIFEDLFPSFIDIDYDKPSDYISIYWNAYINKRGLLGLNDQTLRGINGKIFEYIIATLLIRENIFPIFMNAKVAFVPNINYDLLLYTSDQGPICLSAKTSFRERYKQADLEAIALKYVHRKSKSYLLTLTEADAISVNSKQRTGDVIGLDQAIYTLSFDFDNLITDIKGYNLTDSPTITVIESSQIVTEERIKAVFPNL